MSNNKPLRIAVNGLGRIGRIFLRKNWDNPNFEIVAANSRSSATIYAHLLKYDSVYGIWDKEVEDVDDKIVIDGKPLTLFHEKDPKDLPWGELKVDLVLESTGSFRKREKAALHLEAGAKHVVISAPGKDEDVTLLYNINHDAFDPEKHKVISAASCTTTCLTPIVKVLHENFGLKHGYVATIHAYTNDQNLHDGSHKKEDLRRARAAAESIIPTSTGAAKAVTKLLPELKGKLNGVALRIPLIDPSIISFTAELEKKTTAEDVNNALRLAAEEKFVNSLAVSDKPLVSRDYIGNTYGSIVDALSTEVVDDTLVTVLSWYDNEWGYVSQMSLLLEKMGEKIVG